MTDSFGPPMNGAAKLAVAVRSSDLKKGIGMSYGKIHLYMTAISPNFFCIPCNGPSKLIPVLPNFLESSLCVRVALQNLITHVMAPPKI